MSLNDPLVLFFAVLTYLCIAFVAGVGVLWLLRKHPLAAQLFNLARFFSGPIAAVAAVAIVAGSLYLSEIKNLPACLLCWIERAYLFPQVFVAIGLLFRPRWAGLRGAGFALALLATVVSGYHWAIELWPSFETNACTADGGVSCSEVLFRELGFVTVPVMAFVSGITFMVLFWLSKPLHNSTDENDLAA